MAMKRATGRRRLGADAGAALAAAGGDRAADPARLGAAGLLPPAPRRQGRRAVHDAEVPHHGHRRRGAAGRAGRPREARRAGLQDRRRPARHPLRPAAAPHQPRRAAAADQRPARRHVAGRAAARGGGRRRPLRRAPARPPRDQAGADRADAGLRARRPHLRGAAGDGARLPRQPLASPATWRSCCARRGRSSAAKAPTRVQPMPASLDLEIVIVSHGAEELLRRCLRSLRGAPGERRRCG